MTMTVSRLMSCAAVMAVLSLWAVQPLGARKAAGPAPVINVMPAPQTVRDRLAEDEIIYFVLPDRFANGDLHNDKGGINGDRLKTGYDPTHKGFYHGGDLKGLTDRLDYIQSMGVTAIWFAPIFKNKAVQGPPGDESAGYHGYWVTDFTQVDPHFGTNAEFATFVQAAHARGMKVYMDIIANHTADVIFFRECVGKAECAYRNQADYPYQRRGGINGAPINAGFVGDHDSSAENFAKLTDPNYAYTPFVPPAEANVKVPAWLNDPIYYHNRGNTTFEGESARQGDFVGLDDLMTAHPRVVQGMIDIFGDWIDRFGIDGFRIDTARHVNPAFWQAFVPAMEARAKARGIPNFHIFGEVYGDGVDPGYLAQFTRRDKLPSVLDFSFQAAAREMIAGNAGTERYERLINGDALYEGGDETAKRLPTFLGNHDMGRFGYFIQAAFPKASAQEQLDRAILGHVLLFASRGVPTVYYGDEQGFTGDGNDQAARETLFASKVSSYNDNVLIGTSRTTATDNFGTDGPLFTAIRQLSAMRAGNASLRHGRTVIRHVQPKPGLLAFTRGEPGREVLVALNTSTAPITVNVQVDVASQFFIALAGRCAERANSPGSVSLTLPPLGYAVCAAKP
jgi:neopullulanase